jgi:hypothetical protein
MFLTNKYTTWYYRIIENAKIRLLNGYTERHHIIPKSLGGSDNSENIVTLTAKEHFVCHRLLTKMTEGNQRYKMLHALGCFVQDGGNVKRNISGKQYETARNSIREARIGMQHTDETRVKMSKLAKGRVPWNKGLTGVQQISEEHKQSMKNLYAGKSLDERYGNTQKANEIKEKISSSKLGKPSGMLGKTHTDETKNKMSRAMKGKRGPQQRVVCPCCHEENKTARHVKFCKG